MGGCTLFTFWKRPVIISLITTCLCVSAAQRWCTVLLLFVGLKSSSAALFSLLSVFSPARLPVSCPFPRRWQQIYWLRLFYKNGNYFAWQEISLRLNNGSSGEIWEQGLTFGSLCLLPRLVCVSTLCSVPHQEEVLQETQICGRIGSKLGALDPKRELT